MGFVRIESVAAPLRAFTVLIERQGSLLKRKTMWGWWVLAGLLTSGVLPAMRHCLQNILTDDAILIPAAATVYVQVLQPVHTLFRSTLRPGLL